MPAISEYALIGNGRTAALVGRDGSIDWCCWPRFDGPAVFCRLLDERRGGYFRIGPVGTHRASRAYLRDTNVLETTFSTAEGRARVTDLMPAPQQDGGRTAFPHRILRKVEGLAGRPVLDIVFRPTFDYARRSAELHTVPNGAVARGGDELLSLVCPTPLRREHDALVGRLTLAAGEQAWIAVTHGKPQHARDELEITNGEAEIELRRTQDYWTRWCAACTYDGPYRNLVRRSALVLKALFYEPTGGLVAAPTTSLPEEIGGARNWDYRYTWLRDSGLILDVLQQLGYHDESLGFIHWLEQLSPGYDDLRIMYAVDGKSVPPEQTLEHLAGYRESRPVRLGNAAAGQRQLDVYGHVLDAVVLCFERMPRPMRPELWDVLRSLADYAAATWEQKDRGPWEMRGEPQHFLYSKIYCWVGLDRAIRFAENTGLPGNVDTWRSEREKLRQTILERGYRDELHAFTQAFDRAEIDASALVIPLAGFLPATDERVRSTVQCVRDRLESGGLLYRYRSNDGLPGGEGAFALCSFWLVSNLALAGRLVEARETFERICGYANDVGLLAEEIDPASGELLGNFPQGFTHLGLVRAALHIAAAEAQRES